MEDEKLQTNVPTLTDRKQKAKAPKINLKTVVGKQAR